MYNILCNIYYILYPPYSRRRASSLLPRPTENSRHPGTARRPTQRIAVTTGRRPTPDSRLSHGTPRNLKTPMKTITTLPALTTVAFS